MLRSKLLSLLAEEIISRKKDKPIKVGIDGRGGAGKTTIADELGRVLQREGFDVLRPSVDDFHFPSEYRYRQGAYSAKGYFEDTYDYKTIITSLLSPLSGDQFPVPCRLASFEPRRRNLWVTDTFGRRLEAQVAQTTGKCFA